MASADMNRLMDQARLRLPGALDGMIQMELFSALNEFFKKSNCWYEDVEFAVQPTSETYQQAPDDYTYVVVPSAGTPVRVFGVWDSSGRLVPASMPIPPDIVLLRSPQAAETYIARLVLTVVDPTTRDGYPQFPDWVLKKYGDAVLDGVLARMMAQIAKPYTNLALAGMHMRRFLSETARARIEASRQNTRGAQLWSFPQTFKRTGGR